MIGVGTLPSGYLRAECSVCGWRAVGPGSEVFVTAVSAHARSHRLAGEVEAAASAISLEVGDLVALGFGGDQR